MVNLACKPYDCYHGVVLTFVNTFYCRCASSNPGFPISEAQTSSAFHVNLTFHPKHIRIDRLVDVHSIPQVNSTDEPPRLITITAGELLNLMCTVGPANPPVPLQWRQIICEDAHGGDRNETLREPTSSDTGEASCNVINNFGE